MPTARCGDLTLSYNDLGAGEPSLLFMPGWRASRAAFRELASRLAPHRRTLATIEVPEQMQDPVERFAAATSATQR